MTELTPGTILVSKTNPDYRVKVIPEPEDGSATFTKQHPGAWARRLDGPATVSWDTCEAWLHRFDIQDVPLLPPTTEKLIAAFKQHGGMDSAFDLYNAFEDLASQLAQSLPRDSQPLATGLQRLLDTRDFLVRAILDVHYRERDAL